MVSSQTITSVQYPMTGEDLSVVPLDDFPLPCTKCDQSAMTEDCNYETGICITLSDTSISVIGTNATLIDNGQFSLDAHCTPRYLQKLTLVKYVVICWESSYQLFHTDDLQLEEISLGEDGARDGILVQSSRNEFGSQTHLYHVEIHDSDHLVLNYNVVGGVPGFIFPDNDCTFDSLALHPIFSLHGKFFLSCSTANEERAYFLHSTDTYDDPIRVSLCSDPLSYPNSSTFAVACNSSLEIYMKNNVERHQSKNFSSSIISFWYLNPTTLILDTGNQQIVNVDLFMESSGSDGVLALNGTDTNCSLTRKLLTPDVYATVCTSDELYNVYLLNTTKGQPLPPVSNLTEEPLNIYFNFLPPNTTNHVPTTPITPTDSSSTPPITPTDSGSTPPIMPTDSTPSTPSNDETTDFPSTETLKPRKSTYLLKILLPIICGVLLVVIALVVCTICCCKSYRRKASQQRLPSINIQPPTDIVHSSNGAATPSMSATNSSAISSIAGSQEDLEMAEYRTIIV